MKSGFLTICIVFIYLSAWSQELQENLSIEDLESDTLVTDTSKLVKNVHPQDLEEAKLQIRWRGYVKFNTYYDYSGLKSTEGFLTYEIPVDPNLNKNYTGLYAGARQSRLGMETSINSKIGLFKTYIEGDFAGSNYPLAFRLRHAFGQIGYWTFGHTWSTFTDLAAIPRTVDLEGPNSGVFVRHGLIRYERRSGDEILEYGMSLENPRKDFENPYDSLGIDLQQSFDIAGRLRFTPADVGHIQFAVVLREIFYSHPTGPQYLTGYGFQLSGSINTSKKTRLRFQGVYGAAISRYITTLEGRGLDAYPRDNGIMDPLRSTGSYLAVEYFWRHNWSFSAIAGMVYLWYPKDQPEDSFRSSHYGSINAFWEPIEILRVGTELTVGKRTNYDLNSGTATRLQFAAIFYF
jgi:hypothetical protein